LQSDLDRARPNAYFRCAMDVCFYHPGISRAKVMNKIDVPITVHRRFTRKLTNNQLRLNPRTINLNRPVNRRLTQKRPRKPKLLTILRNVQPPLICHRVDSRNVLRRLPFTVHLSARLPKSLQIVGSSSGDMPKQGQRRSQIQAL